MKALFIAIFTQLRVNTGMKWIDEDYGQIDRYEEGKPPVAFPCALVTIDEADDSLGGGAYDVSNTITVRVAHNRFGDRTVKAPGAAANLTFSKLDDVEMVRDALEGHEVSGVCGRLYLKGIVTERRTDGIAVKVLTFTETH